jgi:hypothetical protein
MVWPILKQKALVWKNSLWRANSRQRTSRLVLYGFGGFLVWGLFRALRSAYLALVPTAPGAADGLLASAFSGLTFFAFFWGLGGMLSQLFVTSDLELLLAAPIQRRDIFVVKLIEGVWGILIPAIMTLTSLMAYGAAFGVAPIYYLLAVVVTTTLMLLLTAVSMIIVLLVVRAVPAGRAREVWTLLWVLVFGAGWVAWMVASQADQPLSWLVQRSQSVAQVGRIAGWTPPGWAAHTLLGFREGDVAALALNAGLLLVSTAAVVAAAGWLFERAFFQGWSGAREVARRARVQQPPERRAISVRWSWAGLASRLAHLLPWPAEQIAHKDWLMLPRDLRQLGRLVLPLLVAGFYVYMAGFAGGQDATRLMSTAPFWLTFLVAPLIPLFFNSTLTVPSLGREGSRIALLKVAPISSAGILWGKYWASVLPTWLIATLATTAIGLLMGVSATSLALLLLIMTWITTVFTAIGVGAGCITPDFNAADPRRSGGMAGGYLSMILGAIFWLTNLGGLAWLAVAIRPASMEAQFLRTILAEQQELLFLLEWAWTPLLVALLYGVVLGATAATWWFGARRLDRWQPA